MNNDYQYIKAKYPDSILLSRVRDFYVTYKQDAVDVSKILGITLMKRNNIEMAMFPYHALDTYLPKIVRAGKKVCICDENVFPVELITPNKQ